MQELGEKLAAIAMFLAGLLLLAIGLILTAAMFGLGRLLEKPEPKVTSRRRPRRRIEPEDLDAFVETFSSDRLPAADRKAWEEARQAMDNPIKEA